MSYVQVSWDKTLDTYVQLQSISVPEAPKNVMVSNITKTTATISWDGNSSANGYIVQDKDNNIVATLDGINNTSYELIGLEPETIYTYKVFAINDEGQSDKTNVIFATRIGDPVIASDGMRLSSGSIKTTLQDMKIGDAIWCKYTASSGVAGSFSELGTNDITAKTNEIPVIGTATPSGYFRFWKVRKGMCVSDRVVQTGVSWDTLNAGKYIEGKANVISTDLTAKIRSLTGGNSYLDVNGNSSTTNANLGAYPSSNEWDRYIVNSDLDGKIIAGDNKVWHFEAQYSWCQETVNKLYYTSLGGAEADSGKRRVFRRFSNNLNIFAQGDSNSISPIYGFRPVLTYKE